MSRNKETDSPLARRSCFAGHFDGEQIAGYQEGSEPIRLNRIQQIDFVEALLNPPEPGARLRSAVSAYKKALGQSFRASRN
jgi:hypothetical protein